MMKIKQFILTKSNSIINALSDLKAIKGILCFGSYTMDSFDEYSDLDLYTFCESEIVSSLVRQNAIQKIEGISEFQSDHLEFGWDNQWCPRGDRFYLNGIQFDIIYNTIDWIRTVVQKVKNQNATSIPELEFRPYTILGLLDNSVIIYDPDSILQEMKSTLYTYPANLKKALLAESIPVAKGSLEELINYIKRGIGNTAFHFHLGRVIDSLGTILFAINERYDPATKRVERIYRQLKIIPENFLDRYKKLLETPLTDEGRQSIVRGFRLLIQEIEDLIKK
ncbi:MAG: nucleotidyltransferase domain-containing protein [Chitinispirillia bacterium]|jgi:predicted nucleotidyltransferase